VSCGCGGSGKLPAKVTLRIEAVRLSQDPQSRMDAAQVYAYLTEDIDVAALDAPRTPVAVGDTPEAVASRNALIVLPIQRIAGFNRAQQEQFRASRIDNLGALAQFDCVRTAIWDQVNVELGRYGLSLAMTTDELRDWVLKGP